MPNTIIIKNSSTVSDVPTAGQLEQGELAINLLDEKLYSKNSSDLIFEIGGGGGGRINTDINTATPPTSEAVTGNFEIYDLADDDELATFGYNASNVLEIRNKMTSGDMEFYVDDNTGTQTRLIRLHKGNSANPGEEGYAMFNRVICNYLGSRGSSPDDPPLMVTNLGGDEDGQTSANLSMWYNSIQAYTASAAAGSTLSINPSGGLVNIGNISGAGTGAGVVIGHDTLWNHRSATDGFVTSWRSSTGPNLGGVPNDAFYKISSHAQVVAIEMGARASDNSAVLTHEIHGAPWIIEGQNEVGNPRKIATFETTQAISGVYIGEVNQPSSLWLRETSAALADQATWGQIWVNSADDSLNYTTEAGVNTDLTAGGGSIGGSIANDQIAIGSGVDTIEGLASLTYDGTGIHTSLGLEVTGGTVDLPNAHFPDNGTIYLGTGDDVTILFSGTDMYTDLPVNADFRVRGEAGSKTWIVATANAGVDLYYNNVLKASSTSAGFDVDGDLSAEQITGELDGLGLYLSHSVGGEILSIHSTGAGEVDFGFTNVTQVNFDSGGKYDFSNDTVQSVGELYLTEQASSAGNIANQFQLWVRNSSPNILFGKTGDGDEHPIGYNSMPPKAVSASQNMLLADVGYMLHKSSGVAITLTCAQDTNTWDGATWAVHNDDTESVTIAAGASVTVYWLEAGSAPAAGSVVVEQGGIVTVYKRSNTEFWVWGAKDASGNDWGADGTMSDGYDIAWADASQPWLTLDSNSAGDNWTSQGAGLSVGESGKKGSAAIHMTYNGDGSGYVGMGTVDNTASTGGRPAFGHLDFTYNAHLVRVGGRLYPGDNSNTVGTVGYIEHAGGQNYGSINVAGAAGSSGTYSGVSVNSRLVLMNNAGTTSGLYNDQNNGWFIQCIEAGLVGLYHNGGLEFRTQQHEGSSITSGAEVYDHAGTFRDVGFNHVKEIAVTTVTLSNLHAGNILRKSGASSYTITLAASSTEFPIGSMCTVLNHGTGGTLTISDGSEAMYIMDGSGTITDSTGFVLAVGGAITIWRQGASEYYVWGAGIP